jgi:hypothetical protein
MNFKVGQIVQLDKETALVRTFFVSFELHGEKIILDETNAGSVVHAMRFSDHVVLRRGDGDVLYLTTLLKYDKRIKNVALARVTSKGNGWTQTLTLVQAFSITQFYELVCKALSRVNGEEFHQWIEQENKIEREAGV